MVGATKNQVEAQFS
jgi:hypothetical protein